MTEENREGQAPEKPRTFDEAFAALAMTPEEEAAVEDEAFAKASGAKRDPEAERQVEDFKASQQDPNAVPPWVEFPPGFKVPPNKQVAFMLFRGSWTDRPEKGDRWCMIWPLSDAEEKHALKRTRGESARTLTELSKQMIHLIDGKRVDWTGSPAPGHVSVERFWDEVGAKCRQQVQNFYLKTHALTSAEQADFFENCLVVRTSTAGG